VELAGLREEVAFVSVELRLSEHTACKLLGVERSSYRYEHSTGPQHRTARGVEKLARQKPCYGYRRLHALLQRLAVRRRKRKRLVRDRALEPRLIRPNQEWAMDFIVDGLATGRMVRILSVVDAYTRKCLALEADTSLPDAVRRQLTERRKVATALDKVVALRAAPESITVDNGTEFASKAMDLWAYKNGVHMDFIRPGKPVENGYIESFNGKLRNECLKVEVFFNLVDARRKLHLWRRDYNNCRPHSALDDRTPAEFAARCSRGKDGSHARGTQIAEFSACLYSNSGLSGGSLRSSAKGRITDSLWRPRPRRPCPQSPICVLLHSNRGQTLSQTSSAI
jgi:putative transposase